MTDSPTLLSLTDRVEKLTGPCRETDALIFRSVGLPLPDKFLSYDVTLVWDEKQQCFTMPVGDMQVRYEHPAYTASLDAAMTLVPPNHRWLMNGPDVDGAGDDIKPCAAVMPYGVSLFLPQDTHQAATPVLAFLSAVLRARSALEANRG